MKLLLWGLIILAILWLLRSKKSQAGATPSAGGHAASKGTEPMLQCAHCGVYVPASDAIVAVSGSSYCSEEHRLRHAS